MPTSFDSHTDLTVLGGPVRLYRTGESGPPVLMLHGAMFDTGAGVWHDLAPALASDHQVYVIDLPRHGGSRPWPGVLDHAFFLRLVDALLDELEIPQVALVGLSMGGGVALGYALERPERVSALVAIGPGGLDVARPYQFLTWLGLRTPGLLRLTSSWLARAPRYLRSAMVDQLVAGERTPGFDRIVDLVTAEARAKAQYREKALDDWQVEAYGPRAMRLNLAPDLPGLAVPTLWLRGDCDELVSAAVLNAAHEATPGSRCATIPGAGHIATYDQPELVADLVGGFLHEVVGH